MGGSTASATGIDTPYSLRSSLQAVCVSGSSCWGLHRSGHTTPQGADDRRGITARVCSTGYAFAAVRGKEL